MINEWSQQELQLGVLRVQTQRYVITFRWLWILNLAAVIIGVATSHHVLTVVAAGSSIVALIGVAFARIARRTVSEATTESHRIQRKLDLQR